MITRPPRTSGALPPTVVDLPVGRVPAPRQPSSGRGLLPRVRPRTVPDAERRARLGARRASERRYARRLLCTDAVVVVAAVVVGYLVDVRTASLKGLGMVDAEQIVVAAGVVVLWLAALELVGARGHHVVGERTAEVRAVIGGTARMFGGFAVVALVVHLEIGRGHLLVTLPLGLVGLCAGRVFWTGRARRWREAGQWRTRALVVASPHAAAPMIARLTADRGAGVDVVAVVWPGGTAQPGEAVADVPVVADETTVPGAVRTHDADTVIVVSADQLGHEWLRTLAWQLDEVGADLVVAPSVADVAGPRMRLRLVSGLSLVRIDQPRYEGANRVGKWLFDILVAAGLVLVTAPALTALALAVRLTSPGPVLFRQERVGLDGRPFTMLKFRSMTDGADARLAELLDAQGTADTPLFKLHSDPRVTRVGAVLRKYSLDELPQLFNVLRGEMSLVGPRPQRPAEVALYNGGDFHRLRVKPGLTGLWQVSGRSDLTWDQTIHLDRYYVENWSFGSDLVLLAKTLRVVLLGTGAR